MDLQKLKTKRSGNRGAVTRLLRKYEEAKENTEFDRQDLLSTYDSLLEKKKLLPELNNGIVNSMDIEDMEEEIIAENEYTTNLNTKLRHFHIFLEKQNQTQIFPSRPTLNAESPAFTPAPVQSLFDHTPIQSTQAGPTQLAPSVYETSHAAPSCPTDNISSTNNTTQSVHIPANAHASHAVTSHSTQQPGFTANSCPVNYSVSHSTGPSGSNSNHRLPKLTLPTFNGKILEWQSFWDAFESAVHSNSTLTDVQKFNYLIAQLDGDASATIAGFAVTNANYAEAVNVLHERFGQAHKITEVQMQTLVELAPPKNNWRSLRSFYDQMEALIRGLESQGQTQESFGNLLVPIIINKLPGEIRRNLARVHGNSSWKLAELRKGILNEIQIIEAGPNVEESSDYTVSTFYAGAKSSSKQQNKNVRSQGGRNLTTKACTFCKEIHSPTNCTKVTDPEARISIVKRNDLCFNCLGTHHIRECKSKNSCRNCSKRHHTCLCNASFSKENTTQRSKSEPKPTNHSNKETASAVVTLVSNLDEINDEKTILHSSAENRTIVLLKTAVAPVWSYKQCTNANILLDEGAQRSFINEDLASALQLRKTGTELLNLSAFGGDHSKSRQLGKATIHVETLSGNKIPIDVCIVPTIAIPLHNNIRYVDRNSSYLKGLRLAQPVTKEDTFDISLLIGADFFWEIVEDEIIRGQGPTAVRSKFGYLLSGPLTKGKPSTSSSVFNVLVSHKFEERDIEKFWKLESIGIEPPEVYDKEADLVDNYQRTSIELRNKKYFAKLPWKEDHDELPTNYNVTKRRTENVVKRLSQTPELLKKYGEIIEDQEKRDFIEKVNECEPSNSKVHYIPHHPVKKDSSTTPIRIVYDCSCKMSANHPSLNDCLMNTPPALNDLTKILIRFRLNPFAVTTDIKKAFLHVGLQEQDRDATRFLWLSEPNNPEIKMITYRFKALLFGATCSPFILNATILKHLQNSDNKVAKQLERDLYVDNVLTSVREEADALEYFQEARKLMMNAGFNLRSWTSNSEKVRTEAASQRVLDSDEQTKVLGLRWNSEKDVLIFPKREITPEQTQLVTKRVILRNSSKIYDPRRC